MKHSVVFRLLTSINSANAVPFILWLPKEQKKETYVDDLRRKDLYLLPQATVFLLVIFLYSNVHSTEGNTIVSVHGQKTLGN